MKKAYSYLYSRCIGNDKVPHHIQNIVFRDYCNRKLLEFNFGYTEVNIKDSWFSLIEMLSSFPSDSVLLFYSLKIIQDNNFPFDVLKELFIESGSELHFCSEDVTISTWDDLLEIRSRLLINKIQEISLLTLYHKKTKRDYFARMNTEKPEVMEVSQKYGQEYWDGDRKYGYGGYVYDGRWKSFAQDLINRYHLSNDSKVLDLGCGKGFVLYELKKILPGISIVGLDISKYAISNSKAEIRDSLLVYDIRNELPYQFEEFDLAFSLMTLHNFNLMEVESIIKELSRVSVQSYIAVESYRNNLELCHLQCWALTCQSFFTPDEWKYLFRRIGYLRDCEFLFFE